MAGLIYKGLTSGAVGRFSRRQDIFKNADRSPLGGVK
jgi:hypothetical protein